MLMLIAGLCGLAMFIGGLLGMGTWSGEDRVAQFLKKYFIKGALLLSVSLVLIMFSFTPAIKYRFGETVTVTSSGESGWFYSEGAVSLGYTFVDEDGVTYFIEQEDIPMKYFSGADLKTSEMRLFVPSRDAPFLVFMFINVRVAMELELL